MSRSDVIVVGAGPYGLAAAAHLARVPGLETRIFGDPMSFWDRHMPKGMFLRSAWTATHIASPEEDVTLEAFQRSSGRQFSTPVPLDAFVEYGRWFQTQAVPHLEAGSVERIEQQADGFNVHFASGQHASARRVVVACGIQAFTWRPPEFAGLPPELVSHAADHRDLSSFAGRRVAVIGSGQSALEGAALLREAGAADVAVFGKAREIHWLQGALSHALHYRLGKATKEFLYAPTDVGPAGLSQLVARPDLVRRLPRATQDRLRRRCVRPAGARWLVRRLEGVPIALGRRVVEASVQGNRVSLRFDNGDQRTADHVMLGTGYRVDIAKYGFWAPGLVERIDRAGGYPRLRPGFETSVPGLHILGSPAAWSFGPLLQFVSGTHYASRRLRHAVERGRVG